GLQVELVPRRGAQPARPSRARARHDRRQRAPAEHDSLRLRAAERGQGLRDDALPEDAPRPRQDAGAGLAPGSPGLAGNPGAPRGAEEGKLINWGQTPADQLINRGLTPIDHYHPAMD